MYIEDHFLRRSFIFFSQGLPYCSRTVVVYCPGVPVYSTLLPVHTEDHLHVSKDLTQEAKYIECWPCPPFDTLLNKYFPAG